MTKGTNFKLIYDLFDHVFIFDDKNELIFKGSSLNNLLKDAGIDVEKFTSGGLDNKDNPLASYIASVKTDRLPQSFTFNEIPDEFILFPSVLDDKIHIILAKGDKIIRIPKIEFDLNERAKELECLYQISRELESSKTFKESLAKCPSIIEGAFQFPSETLVNIEIDKKLYGDTDQDPENVENVLNVDIVTNDQKRGELRVYILNRNHYLEEEIKLVNEIAGKLGRALEKHKKTINLEKQKKILILKNEALVKMTNECHQKQEKLRAFFSAITETIVVVNQEFDIIMSNKDDIGDSGKCYNKLFGLDKRCENCPAQKTFETTQDVVIEREEKDIYYRLRSYPIFNANGKADRVLEVCSNITEIKKMQAQLLQSYKLASLGKLVAGVAHEINNPNTFILGNLKIIQESLGDIFPILDAHYEENKELIIARLNYDVFKDNISTLVADMINGANRTKKIVGDLRNFAKKDDDILTEDVDINFIIRNNLTLTRKHIKKIAQLDIELDENIPVFRGSSNKLEQVLLNLIINASEAVENGEGVITLKTGYDTENKHVILKISDNGNGMDENTLRNIFDPFYTTKRNRGGTGLGLSITYGIIKDHNGFIEVDSKVGGGTTFTIKIPAKVDE